jgi:hypothetical protein
LTYKGSNKSDDGAEQPVALLIAWERNTTNSVAATVDDFQLLAVAGCDGNDEVAESRRAPVHSYILDATTHECGVETVALQDQENDKKNE